MFKTTPDGQTRVVSLNTDSIVLQIKPGDEARVSQVVQDWESCFGFAMERTEVLAHRGLNINSYIELVREGDGRPEIKSKGLLAHLAGIGADHNALIVAQALGQWLLDGTRVEHFIQQGAERRDILMFTEMRSAPSSCLRSGGVAIGKLARVYRSTRTDLPSLTKDATGAAGAQTLEEGFAYLPDTDWPAQDDVDVAWYVQQARLLIAQTATAYSPHHNTLAQQLGALGLTVAGVGGAASVLSAGLVDEEALARGTAKNPRNFSGDRALAISLAKAGGLICLPAGVASADSLVLSYGTQTELTGEIHARARLTQTVRALKKLGVNVMEKGDVLVYDPRQGLRPWASGQAHAPRLKVPKPKTTPADGGLPVSNDDFLALMFGPALHSAFVCSNRIPPDTPDEQVRLGMWVGGPLEFSRGLYQQADRQNYTCVASFKRNQEGGYRRQIEFFEALHFIVLDDIGTKVAVDPRTLGFGEPTYINETSPGNHQWLYRLKQPVHDLSVASFLTRQVLGTPVKGQLMTDQGAKGVTRLCKLPVGMNLKLSLGAPWSNRQISWRPELAYDAQEIARWFGTTLEGVPTVHAGAAAPSAQAAEHPLIEALRAAGLLKSAQQKSGGWWDIECHQKSRHTQGIDNGTAVKVREDGSWTYKCQHGHCSDLTPRDLHRWLVNQGHTLTPPQHRSNVARIDRSRLVFDSPDMDEAALLGPDDGGANEEVDYPDPECSGAGAVAGGGGGGKDLPLIYIDPGLIDRTIRQCAQTLDDVVFKRGEYLVRIGKACELSDGIRRAGTQPLVVSVKRQWLVRELTRRATFMRWDQSSKDYRVVDCPVNIASTVETGTDDDTFRALTALANAPFLREDGSVCCTPGYDDETGIYYAPSLNFPPINPQPSWADARASLDELVALTHQFPFASEAARSVYLVDVLTAVARPTLPKSPIVLYSATMAGTGKTLMASIANLIAYGHATTHPWPNGNEEELRKIFTSILLAGDPVVVFDNLPNGGVIKSAALSQFATSDDYADRKLGESERVRFKNRTRLVLTGNNITLASDNARRTLVCELELEVESPRDREIAFEHPSLATHIKAHRARLITAALTVLRAYAIHPEPLRLPPLESFEDWSWRVRDALVWLGQADPVAAVQFDNDGAGDIASALLQIRAVAQAKLRTQGAGRYEFGANELASWAASNYALRDALEQAGCSDTSSAGKLGYWLRANKNRNAGGLRLLVVKVNGGKLASKWQLVNSK